MKLKAIENLHKAGVEIVPVVTIVNGINNEQVGRIIKFALDNPKTISFLSFQPVSFTGRDEAVTDDRRQAQRYTLSHLAHDVKNQTGLGEPARDWFPISFMGTFSDWADLMHAQDANNDWGQLSCGCHPNGVSRSPLGIYPVTCAPPRTRRRCALWPVTSNDSAA